MDKITSKQASDALLRSGYLLESEIESTLVSNGFYVESNTAYTDPTTGKARELDLYAMQGFKLSRDNDFFFPVLLIECVNNSQPIAFITKESQIRLLHIDALKMAGLPVKVYSFDKGRLWTSLHDSLKMENYHHYCRGRIANQFCSFAKKKGSDEWMALHEDSQFDALRKLCDAVEYFVDKQFKAWVFTGAPETINIEVYHPILLLQGELMEVRVSKRGPRLLNAKHIPFRRTSIVGSDAKDYHIDVVAATYFDKYIEILHDEWKKTEQRLKRRKDILRKSARKIVKEARRFKSPEKIREAMEL